MHLVLFVALVICATCCAWQLAVRLPWRNSIKSDGVVLAIALCFGPLLTGMLTVIVLWVLPGIHPAIHVAVVFGALVLAGWRGLMPMWRYATALCVEFRRSAAPLDWALMVLSGCYIVAIVIDATTTVLVQNDALEYATVGRALFESGDLRTYPLLEPEATASGFFGPWTHPPLYVALAYLAYAMQGSAAEPALFRLFGPWCLTAAVFTVAVLGRRLSGRSGLVAALICLSTPTLYLGAVSAQIDPLAVLGFTLALAVFVSGEGSWLRYGAACGLSLGFALWTHSQAIIYPLLLAPSLLFVGPRARWGERIKFASQAFAVAVAAALVVGGAPYIRNYFIFGAPISDNPAVFAFAPLGWGDFFEWQRGLAHVQEIVQYGVLKGYFAVEVFSFVFWLGLIGMPFALKAIFAQLKRPDADRSGEGPADAVAIASLLATLTYYGGMVLSVLFGIDLMIRNDRYMLVLVPCSALLGSAGLLWLGRFVVLDKLVRAAVVLLCLGLAAQLAALVFYRGKLTSHYARVAASPASADTAAKSGPEYLRLHTPVDAQVLALCPADMFYAGRKMVSYLDPRLMPFYKADSIERAFDELQRLGIDYIQLPDYSIPPDYNSFLMPLLASSEFTELVFDSRGYQIYRLNESRQPSLATAASLPAQWKGIYRLKLGSLGIGQRTVGEFGFVAGQPVSAWNSSLILRRLTTTSFESAPATVGPVCGDRRPREFLVELDVSGEGYLQVFADQASAAGEQERMSIGGIALAPGERKSFKRRIQIGEHAETLGLLVEFRPIGAIAIDAAALSPLCPVAPERSSSAAH